MVIEKSVIGGLLENPEIIADIYDVLRAQDFEDQKCGIVYDAMIEIVKEGGVPDLLATSKVLVGKIDLGWLSGLSDNACFKSRLKHEAYSIYDKSREAELKKKITEVTKSTLGADSMIDDLLCVCGDSMSRESRGGTISEVIARFRETVASNKVKEYGLDTGYMFLEDKYIRYMPGYVWIIGAYTSVGKTAVFVDMLCRMHEMKNPRTVIISTEMMEEQNVARFLARQTGHVSNLILSGKIREGQDEIEASLDWFSKKDIFLFDNLYSLQDIEMRLRQITMSGNIDVVFIDYVQNMSFKGAASEYDKTQKIAKGLQRIAKQLKCCIVCLSQIPNSAAKDDNGLLEYKGGGELAAVADIGIWLKRNKIDKELLAFEIRKNRHGATGKQILQFVNHFKRLKEIPHDDNE